MRNDSAKLLYNKSVIIHIKKIIIIKITTILEYLQDLTALHWTLENYLFILSWQIYLAFQRNYIMANLVKLFTRWCSPPSVILLFDNNKTEPLQEKRVQSTWILKTVLSLIYMNPQNCHNLLYMVLGVEQHIFLNCRSWCKAEYT